MRGVVQGGVRYDLRTHLHGDDARGDGHQLYFEALRRGLPLPRRDRAADHHRRALEDLQRGQAVLLAHLVVGEDADRADQRGLGLGFRGDGPGPAVAAEDLRFGHRHSGSDLWKSRWLGSGQLHGSELGQLERADALSRCLGPVLGDLISPLRPENLRSGTPDPGRIGEVVVDEDHVGRRDPGLPGESADGLRFARALADDRGHRAVQPVAAQDLPDRGFVLRRDHGDLAGMAPEQLRNAVVQGVQAEPEVALGLPEPVADGRRAADELGDLALIQGREQPIEIGLRPHLVRSRRSGHGEVVEQSRIVPDVGESLDERGGHLVQQDWTGLWRDPVSKTEPGDQRALLQRVADDAVEVEDQHGRARPPASRRSRRRRA